MKIRQKLALSIGALLLLVTTLLSYVALSSAGKLGRRLGSVYRDAILPLAEADAANDSLDDMHIFLLGAIGETGSLQQRGLNEFAKSQETFAATLDKYEKEFTIATQPEMQTLLKQYGALEEQMTREQNALRGVDHDYPLLKSSIDRVVDLLKKGRRDEALSLYYNDTAPLFDKVNGYTHTFAQLQLEQGDYSRREGQAVLTAVKRQIGAAVVVTSIFAFIMVLVLNRILIRPLDKLRDAALQLGQGQLNTRIPIHSKDELGDLGRSFNLMADDLSKLMQERVRAQAELSKAYETAKTSVAQLECRNREAAILSEMGDLLQSCFTVEEASRVIALSAQKLFHGFSGALLMFSASRNVLEAVTTWGQQSLVEGFSSLHDCWALRRGRLHLSGSDDGAVRCAHFGAASPLPSLCVPLMAHGETLGILSLVTEPSEPSRAPASISEFKVKLAVSVAEQTALSFANLKLRDKLRYQSVRDPLTGLFNRRYLDESLERELANATRKNRSVGVIMLDVDRFKKFNDMFGHDAGDTVLRELGNHLANSIRRGDVACRYGGEEFTLILPESSLEHTRRRAEEVRTSFQQLSIKHRDILLGRVTLSLGVAALPDHGTTAVELLAAADGALRRAKEEGRDRVLTAEASPSRSH